MDHPSHQKDSRYIPPLRFCNPLAQESSQSHRVVAKSTGWRLRLGPLRSAKDDNFDTFSQQPWDNGSMATGGFNDVSTCGRLLSQDRLPEKLRQIHLLSVTTNKGLPRPRVLLRSGCCVFGQVTEYLTCFHLEWTSPKSQDLGASLELLRWRGLGRPCVRTPAERLEVISGYQPHWSLCNTAGTDSYTRCFRWVASYLFLTALRLAASDEWANLFLRLWSCSASLRHVQQNCTRWLYTAGIHTVW